MERPAIVTQEHLDFLDELRESGDTNMYGADPFLRDAFPELAELEARDILRYWMQSFTERHPACDMKKTTQKQRSWYWKVNTSRKSNWSEVTCTT